MVHDTETNAPSCLFCYHDASTSTLNELLHGHLSDGYYHTACFEAYCKAQAAINTESDIPLTTCEDLPKSSGGSVACPLCRNMLEVEVRVREVGWPLEMAPLLTAFSGNHTSRLLEMLPNIPVSKYTSDVGKGTENEKDKVGISLTAGQLLVLLQYALNKEDRCLSKEWGDVAQLLMGLVYSRTPKMAFADKAFDEEEQAGQVVPAEQDIPNKDVKHDEDDDLKVDVKFAEKFCRVMRCEFMMRAFLDEQHGAKPTNKHVDDSVVAKKVGFLQRLKRWLKKVHK